jgi:hypothetical protein
MIVRSTVRKNALKQEGNSALLAQIGSHRGRTADHDCETALMKTGCRVRFKPPWTRRANQMHVALVVKPAPRRRGIGLRGNGGADRKIRPVGQISGMVASSGFVARRVSGC